MTGGTAWSTGQRGTAFLTCLVLTALTGWVITRLFAVDGGGRVLAAVTLPGVLLLGYAIWHVRRVVRTISGRLAGARRVGDDPVAERAGEAFRRAGWLGGLGSGVLLWIVAEPLIAAVMLVAAMAWGRVLGTLASAGRLPIPELE